MEDCELCGRPTEHVYVVDVEGVELRVCPKCAKGKKVVRDESVPAKAPKPGRVQHAQHAELQLVDDYGARIRAGRESMKIPMRVLAEMLNEKETFLSRVEEQKTAPPEALVKKLEKALGIKLLEEPAAEASESARRGKENATLGDFVG